MGRTAAMTGLSQHRHRQESPHAYPTPRLAPAQPPRPLRRAPLGLGDGPRVPASAARSRLLNEAKLDQRAQQLAAVRAADLGAAPPASTAGPAPPAPAPAVRPAWLAKRPAGRTRQQRRLAQA